MPPPTCVGPESYLRQSLHAADLSGEDSTVAGLLVRTGPNLPVGPAMKPYDSDCVSIVPNFAKLAAISQPELAPWRKTWNAYKHQLEKVCNPVEVDKLAPLRFSLRGLLAVLSCGNGHAPRTRGGRGQLSFDGRSTCLEIETMEPQTCCVKPLTPFALPSKRRRLRRVVADVGREPGFGPTRPRSRPFLGARQEIPGPARLRRATVQAASSAGLRPTPHDRRGSSRQPPAVSFDRAPIACDVARRAFRCVCPCSAITALRHWVACWRLTSALPTTPRHARQETRRTVARRHDSCTTDFFTDLLTAAALDAASAACHYTHRRTAGDPSLRACNVLRRVRVVTGGPHMPANRDSSTLRPLYTALAPCRCRPAGTATIRSFGPLLQLGILGACHQVRHETGVYPCNAASGGKACLALAGCQGCDERESPRLRRTLLLTVAYRAPLHRGNTARHFRILGSTQR